MSALRRKGWVGREDQTRWRLTSDSPRCTQYTLFAKRNVILMSEKTINIAMRTANMFSLGCCFVRVGRLFDVDSQLRLRLVSVDGPRRIMNIITVVPPLRPPDVE